MRFISTLINDIRFQIRYGFYFLYIFISGIYIGVLLLCPADIRPKAASLIILTDPAMLGMFFMGGIWLLEKGEGLHSFWKISPLRTLEYVLSKAISLSVISTLAAIAIALIGLKNSVNIVGMTIYVFLGSIVFTTIGLWISTFAQSVNQYMLIASIPSTLLITPAILDAFGLSYPFLSVLPSMALWHGIGYSTGLIEINRFWTFLVMLIWLILALYLTNARIPTAFKEEGGERL